MTPVEAARLLELPDNATPEQLEARYNELRAKLEDKIAKAPTPGLKVKYRENLDQVTAAFETLTLAADSSALPVLTKQQAKDGGRKTEAGVAIPLREPVSAHAKSKGSAHKSGKEFVVVALIAVAVLAGGAWWVMKTRAEKAEQARIMAEAKMEADRKAAAEKAEQERKSDEARLAAEAKRSAEEEEKARAAAAAQAEQDRLGKVLAQTSAQLVDLRIGWEAVEQEARRAERRLAELRGEERSQARASRGPELSRLRAEIAAQAAFTDWLEIQLGRHEAKVLRAQAEAMISVRQLDEAARIAARAAAAQAALDREVTAARTEMLTISAALSVDLKPAEAEWVLTDAYGMKHTGKGARQFKELPLGPMVIETSLAGYQPKRIEAELTRGQPGVIAHEFKPAVLRVDSAPQGAAIALDGRPFGVTPATIEWPGEGEVKLALKLRGYRTVVQDVSLSAGMTVDSGTITLRDSPPGVTRPDFGLGPRRYVLASKNNITSRSTNSMSPGNESTHTFSFQSEFRVEIDTPTNSSADATRVTFTTLSQVHDGKPMMFPDTVQEYAKLQKGWWRSFKKGGFIDPALRAHQKDEAFNRSPVERRILIDDPAWWPTEEKYVDDTWEVPFTAINGTGLAHLWDSDPRGKITGRVVSLNGEDGEHFAQVEFTFEASSTRNVTDSTMTSHVTGRLNCTVDLRRRYVSAVSYTKDETSDLTLTATDYQTNTKSTTTATYSIRPL